MTAPTVAMGRSRREPVRRIAGSAAAIVLALGWVSRQICRSLSQDLERVR